MTAIERLQTSKPIESLTDEQIALMEKRLAPGNRSQVGFLANGYSLKLLTNENNALLKELGVTYKQFSNRLESIICRWEVMVKNNSDRANLEPCIEGKYLISVQGTMGVQECPFTNLPDTDVYKDLVLALNKNNCGKPWGSSDYKITNKETGENMLVASLVIHLFNAHHFNQKSQYEIDLKKGKSLLEIKPGEDYAPVKKTVRIWSSGGSSSEIETTDKTFIIATAHEKKTLKDGIRAYVINGKTAAEKEPPFSFVLPKFLLDNEYLFIVNERGPDSLKDSELEVLSRQMKSTTIDNGIHYYTGDEYQEAILTEQDVYIPRETAQF